MLHRKILNRITLITIFSLWAFSGAAEGAKIDDDNWCENLVPLPCINEYFTDTQTESAPLNFDSGIWYPMLGGIFSTHEKLNRIETKNEPPSLFLSEEHIDNLIQQDISNAYRVLSANPTARQLFVSLSLLAGEVMEQKPADYPVGYLFMTKIVESTLYLAAHENNHEIYCATENFHNCVQISIMIGRIDRRQAVCRPDLNVAANAQLEIGG